ncbi:Trypsin 5G1 [Eumeta japonica]|uniref:Trypsin 5G1 n=1 Tax=Eumeta variegata TaxID=151549 RepID=A0A4C1YQJ7_EUMVA|nr:Trypsin 5G1 [Eumeta japonica]
MQKWTFVVNPYCTAGQPGCFQEPFCLFPSSATLRRTADLMLCQYISSPSVTINARRRNGKRRKHRHRVSITSIFLLPDDRSSESAVGIVGGHTIPIENAPYMASLRLNGTYHWCGGAIIHRRFVVTAAHCIVPNREYKISVGSNSIETGGILMDVEELIIHDKYDPSEDYDICLVKLKEEIPLSEKVSLIELADSGLKLKTGTMMNITGWGNSKENGRVSTYLQQTTVPLVGRRSCKFTYMAFLHPISVRMICAGEVGHDACQGDSGGPLTYKDHLVGVSSFGVGCGTYPGVYTKISAMLPWITEKIDESS